MKHYALSVLLTKTTPEQYISTHSVHVYYNVSSEAEAKGRAVEDALKLFEGFSISSVACVVIRSFT